MRYARNLKQVRGVGISREGAIHWMREKASQAALLVLGSWLFISVIYLWDKPYIVVILWMSELHNFILLSLTIFIGFLHAETFIRVIVEDYVHSTAGKLIWFSMVKILVWLSIAVSIGILIPFLNLRI